jgi:hypothetical protein
VRHTSHMTTDIFQLLSRGERIIVQCEESDRIVITWNQSLTLQAWLVMDSGRFAEVSAMTLSNIPASFNAAREKAIEWATRGIEDDR